MSSMVQILICAFISFWALKALFRIWLLQVSKCFESNASNLIINLINNLRPKVYRRLKINLLERE